MTDTATRKRKVSTPEDRATRIAAVSFLVAIAAGIGLMIVYFAGGDTQLEGALLFVAFAGVTVGLVVWAKVIIAEEEVIEERPEMRSSDEDRAAFQRAWEGTRPDLDPDPENTSRRRFLSRLLAGAGASLALALLLPFRSLGPTPQQSLFNTDWRPSRRLVSYDGRPIRPDDLAVGSVITVFPDGEVGDADSQTLLINVGDDLDLPPGSPETVEGFVAYSKICTHAGCPVGLYRSQVGELLCPCHASRFDVYHGAVPISGPTVRPLPQLPLGIDDEGYFVALGDFEAPVGPGFWDLYSGQEEQA